MFSRQRLFAFLLLALAVPALTGCQEGEMKKLKAKAEQINALLTQVNTESGKLINKISRLAGMETQNPRPEGAIVKLKTEIDSEQKLLDKIRDELGKLVEELVKESKELSDGDLKDALDWLAKNLPEVLKYLQPYITKGLAAAALLANATEKTQQLQSLVANEVQVLDGLARAEGDERIRLQSQLDDMMTQHAAISFYDEIRAAQEIASLIDTATPFPLPAGTVYPKETFFVREGLPSSLSHLDDGVLAKGSEVTIQLPPGWSIEAPAEFTSENLVLDVQGNVPGSSRITLRVMEEKTPEKTDDQIAVTLNQIRIGGEPGLAEAFLSVVPGRTWVQQFLVLPSTQPIPPPPSVSLTAPATRIRPGETTQLEVQVSGLQGLAGANVSLSVSGGPPLQVDPAGITPGSLFAEALIAANQDSAGGINVALALGKTVNGPGTVAVIPVKIPAEAAVGTAYQVAINKIELYDALGNPVPATAGGGVTLTVSALPGDVDFDGAITVRDAQLSLRLVIGLVQPTPAQLSTGDINANGRLDVGDSIRILRAAIGLEKLGQG